MKENKNKFDAFKSADIKDWEVAARGELNGANPWGKLTQQGSGWSIRPFYDRNDVVQPFSLPASEHNSLGPRAWYNCPGILVEDEKEANQTALEYLKEGADGIFFELDDRTDFALLLKDIEWQHCSLNFLANKNQASIATGLHDFIEQKKISKKHLHGAFFGGATAPQHLDSGIRLAGFQTSPSSSPVEELVSSFLAMITTLKGHFPLAAGQVAFSVAVGNDFFLDLAKLRAIRTLWHRCLGGVESYGLPELFVHAYSMPWAQLEYQPHENMLKSTTAAMAAILGGCDALTIAPEDANHPMMARVARNVSNLLREESHFSKVADPVAGAYFIEDLTHQLTESAWVSLRKYFEK